MANNRLDLATLGITTATAVMVLPSTLFDYLQLLDHDAFHNVEPFIYYGSSATIALCGSIICARLIGPPFLRRLASRSSVAHLDQRLASEKYPHYEASLRRHFPLLNLSLSEFAAKVNLTPLQAWALLRNPHIIPRPELLPSIEAVLLLPEGFFKKGRSKQGARYGEALVHRRWDWHMERNPVSAQLLRLGGIKCVPLRTKTRMLHDLEDLIEKNNGKEAIR